MRGNRFKAYGRVKKGTMNKLEEAYGQYLQTRLMAGEIQWYKFEAAKFRLAENTFYTPDYMVMLADGSLEAHEVKGFWEDDARVKIKVAASIYPFQFIAITRKKQVWSFEEF